MNFADAIIIAIRLCKAAGEDQAASVLRQLPHMRIAKNAERINKALANAGIDLNAILAECNLANESRDLTAMKVANAKLAMATKVITASERKETT